MRWIAGAAAVGVFWAWGAAATARAVCLGDCNGDTNVSIGEAVTCTHIRAGEMDLSMCPNCDGDGDHMVDDCEAAQAVRNAQSGCSDFTPCEPTATPTETPTVGSPTSTLTPTATITCFGDCDGNGRVTVDELIRASDIALGIEDSADCPALGAPPGDRVGIDELVRAVASALQGCPD